MQNINNMVTCSRMQWISD